MKKKIHLSLAAIILCTATNTFAIDLDRLQMFGYGNVNYSQHDYLENYQSKPEKRAKVDLERFVMAQRYLLDDTTTIVTEIEYEHGGTGSTLEYDGKEEMGEFETEIEKGGEIVVEELAIMLTQNPKMSFKIGHFPVAIGMLSSRHVPSLYHSATRNRSESRIIPATWHETGLEVFGSLIDNSLHYQVQLVNGLNSENFDSSGWIKFGSQRRFEYANADDLALNLRVSYGELIGNQIGFSYYQGDTGDNRHKTQLKSKGTVKILSFHAVYKYKNTDIKALFIKGILDDNNKITAANYNLPGKYRARNHPVAKEAIAYFVELGQNIAPSFNMKKETILWARYDFSDTMYKAGKGVIDRQRYEQTTISYGLNYHYSKNLIFKSEFETTKFGSSLDDMSSMTLSAAFQF